MPRLGLVGASYRSQSVVADCQTCMNWYLERIESDLGKGPYALYPAPGLNKIYNLGGVGVRGEITVQGRSFAVAGQNLWELLAPNASPNIKNWSAALSVPLGSDGLPVTMAGGGHQLLIASAGNAFVFDLSANTLVPVDPSAGAKLPIAQVVSADNFFFALVQNPAPTPWQINSSNILDATTWQGTNFTEVSVFFDNPLAIFRAARLLWIFGPNGIQPYTDAGDFPFPFDVIPGTFIENGLAASLSIAKLDNSLFWLGSDERGNGMVWRANGFTPQRVSNHAVEYALQSYATIADAVAYAYQDQGHSFYVLGLPTADKTWVYDAATQQWHERGFWNSLTGKFNRHRAAFHTFNFGMHLVGDPTTGAVYQMAINIPSDFGNAIRRVRRAPHVSKEGRRIVHSRLYVDAEVGIGPNLQGSQATTVFTLADATGAAWSVQITDVGTLEATPGGLDFPVQLYLTDAASNTTWKLVVNTLGDVGLTAVPFDYTSPASISMVSVSGQKQWQISARQIAGNIAQIVTQLLGIVGRGPLWTLAWSDDNGQTFTGGQARDGGQTGEFRRRLIWNRLGAPLIDRVYELSISDPVLARVIDAYLDADGSQPSERLSKEMAKRA